MKIIDKYKDYYDYCQHVYPDDTFTFDRRSSFNLDKSDIAHNIRFSATSLAFGGEKSNCNFLLLQICNTFWLLTLRWTKSHNGIVDDYEIADVQTWKDYTKDRKQLCLQLIHFSYSGYFLRKQTMSLNEYLSNKVKLVMSNDYHVDHTFDNWSIWNESKQQSELRTIPLLNNTGIPSVIPPEDIYFSLDEYFSAEKTASERTSSEPITDVEKAINHGFDKRTSFRNVK